MQFITDGPDVPSELLHAHEEGKVIFFCGAGISYPAGLPGFEGLVEEIYKRNHTWREADEDISFKQKQFDATLNLLEQRLPGGQPKVLEALWQVLQPKAENLEKEEALNSHKALLQLGRNRDGRLQLVTTNFDRLFHLASQNDKTLDFASYGAPLLPIPKKNHWDGLVFLHGLLPENCDEVGLNNLVVTSGDFGLAYLLERWAARFVSELFHHYTVCFVGYSLNDPILRYMTDALAADRRRGNHNHQAWAFAGYKASEEESNKQKVEEEWSAKGVCPILYRVPSDNSADHSALHKTLTEWAQLYPQGLKGKEEIIEKYARRSPKESNERENFVSRVLWALSDPSGLPAKQFAELNPVPSLEWLKVFQEECFNSESLPIFGISSKKEDRNFKFNLLNRPSPPSLAPSIQLISVSDEEDVSRWDNPMLNLADWLLRHLNDPELFFHFTEKGGRLHPMMARKIRRKLIELDGLQEDKKEEIQSQAPNAIPSFPMQKLWHLLLAGHFAVPQYSFDKTQWLEYLYQKGKNEDFCRELGKLLKPCLKVQEEKKYNVNNSNKINEIFKLDLILNIDDIFNKRLRDKLLIKQTPVVLVELLEEFQQQLIEALDLIHEIIQTNDEDNFLFLNNLPIASYSQNNQQNYQWTILIELLRDTWLNLSQQEPKRARQIAQDWFQLPYFTFKRLALFAASQGCISPKEWVDWLLTGHTLWLENTKNEVFQLIKFQGKFLAKKTKKQLEAAILRGPERSFYQEEQTDEEWQDFSDRFIWLRLVRLEESGLKLNELAAKCLKELSQAHPEWKNEESNEFSDWSNSWTPSYEEKIIKKNKAPLEQKALAQWLKAPISRSNQLSFRDNWSLVCYQNPEISMGALADLAREKIWPEVRWRQALDNWHDEILGKRNEEANKKLINLFWSELAPLLMGMPEETFYNLAQPLSLWLQEIALLVAEENESSFIKLCEYIIAFPTKSGKNFFGEQADVHPIGAITTALIHFSLREPRHDGDGLPDEINKLLTKICTGPREEYGAGHTILGIKLITLFQLDKTWTEQNILPRLDWQKSNGARDFWIGFLRSPQSYPPLFKAFKSHFLEMTKLEYYEPFEDVYKKQITAGLTLVALTHMEGYSNEELRQAIAYLPVAGLENVAHTLFKELQKRSDQREAYWRNRIAPFWKEIWPKNKKLMSPTIRKYLALLAIEAGNEFPQALELMGDWLLCQGGKNTGNAFDTIIRVIQTLESSRYKFLIDSYPKEFLKFLDILIPGDFSAEWLGSTQETLKEFLEKIKQANPSLAEAERFRRLESYT